MNSHQLNGEFQFKILYQNENTRVESDFFPNFITSKGLSFPYYTGFAGLLNYLSLGSGTGYNYIGTSENPTSGLYEPIKESGFFNSTGVLLKTIGSRLNSSGITFYKTWVVPSSTSFASKNYPIKEFSISTFSPDIFLESELISKGNIYEENGAIIPKYLNLTGAFARVTGDFELKSGEQLFVTYRLNLGFETGIKKFINVVNTQGANKLNGSHESFNHFSGINSLMSPAVNFLLPLEGSILEGKPGEVKEASHIGLGMEPSTPAENLFCYLSTDESQFLLNTSENGGVLNLGQYTSGNGWQNSKGIHQYIYNSPLHEGSIKENIRNSGISAPTTGNIFESEAPLDVYVFKNDTVDISFNPQYLKIDGIDRKRSLVRSFGFLANENNKNMQFKSLVVGYQKSEDPEKAPDGEKIIPFVDFLLGTSLNELKPNTGVYLKEENNVLISYTGWFPNSGNYLNLDENNNLTLSFKLIWSSPCSDAIDCP